jgi:hypothetical protein
LLPETRETKNRFNVEEEVSLIANGDSLIIPVEEIEKKGEARFPSVAELCWRFTFSISNSPIVREKRAEFTQLHTIVGDVVFAERVMDLKLICIGSSANVPG